MGSGIKIEFGTQVYGNGAADYRRKQDGTQIEACQLFSDNP